MSKQRFAVISGLLVLVALIVVGCAGVQPVTQTVVETVEVEKLVEIEKVVEVVSEAEAERRKTVIFDIDGGRVANPELWNPYVPGHRRDQGFHQALMEPLFLSNLLSGEIEPWLGTEMIPNETLDVWTLKLREGVKWSDGEAFNADDVVFSVQMAMASPELNDQGLRSWVSEVEKLDDLTVRFTLLKPNPRFQLDHFSVKIWGSFAIVPEHIWKDQDPLTFTYYDPDKGWPVFTGPYLLDRVSETEFIYVRDDNWWGAQTGWKELPKPEKLIWVWYGPEETRTAAIANSGLDSVMDITLGAFLSLQKRNPNVIAWSEELPYAHIEPTCTRTLEFNNAVEPWNDKDMRWAINYAIDRDQIVTIAYEGTTVKSRHYFPISEPLEHLVDKLEEAGLYDKYPIPKYDPELAKQIIESKGYMLNKNGYYEKDGQELTFDIQIHEAFIEKQRIAQVLVEQFQALGINASMRTLAGGTWGENFDFGNYEVRMGWQTCGSVNEPWASMDRFNTKWLKPIGERAEGNEWRWSGEAAESYSTLVDEMGILPLGDPRVEELFIEANELWMAELPVIPITQARKLTPFDTTFWTGWPTSENRYASPTTWWQNAHKVIHTLEPVKP